MEMLEKYIKELEIDTYIDRVCLEEKQLKLPGIRAKWISRWINTKHEVAELYNILDDARDKVCKKLKEESKIVVSDIAIEKKAEDHELVKKIKKEIKSKQLIIEFLEKVEKSTASMTFDCSNIINLIKSEQM